MVNIIPSRKGLWYIGSDKGVVGESGVGPAVFWSVMLTLVGGHSQVMHQLPQRTVDKSKIPLVLWLDYQTQSKVMCVNNAKFSLLHPVSH